MNILSVVVALCIIMMLGGPKCRLPSDERVFLPCAKWFLVIEELWSTRVCLHLSGLQQDFGLRGHYRILGAPRYGWYVHFPDVQIFIAHN